MVSYTTESIRNIALVGHGAAGKTTLVESILLHAGKLATPGAVEKGNTVCDFDPQEKAHQHSLDAALVNLDYHGAHMNLIDTPGFPDFIGQALAALPARTDGRALAALTHRAATLGIAGHVGLLGSGWIRPGRRYAAPGRVTTAGRRGCLR